MDRYRLSELANMVKVIWCAVTDGIVGRVSKTDAINGRLNKELYERARKAGESIRDYVMVEVDGYMICKLCGYRNKVIRSKIDKILKYGVMNKNRRRRHTRSAVFITRSTTSFKTHLKRNHKYEVLSMLPEDLRSPFYELGSIR